MKIKSIITASALFLIAGYIFSSRYQLKHPYKVLSGVKQHYKDIEAAFITYTPESYKKLGLETMIYKGGITTKNGDYEFITDAYTGELLDTTEITTT